MAEFNVHHSVHQLMQLLEVQSDPASGISEASIAERLIESSKQGNRKATANAKFLKKLDNAKNSEFKPIYEDLKAKNIIEVDALVQLLARISDNEDVKNFIKLQKLVKDKSRQQNVPSSTGLDTLPSSRISTARSRLTSTSSTKDGDDGKCSVTTNATNYHSDHTTPTQLNHYPMTPTGSSLGVTKTDTLDERRIVPSSARSSASRHSKRDSSRSKLDKKTDFSCLTYDFSPFDWPSDVVNTPLSSMSITEQENALIDDLLYVLVGIEGRYIRRSVVSDKKFRLVVDDGADKLLKTLVERIIIICPLYSCVIFFIEHHDFGLVNQALIAFMRGVIHDYFLLLTQLEYQHRLGDMTLQKMWFFLREIHSDLEILKHVSHKIRQGKCIGGAVLSILHEKTISHTGNVRASDFCMKMTSRACKPYFSILERWISEGIIVDEYKEFFIEDTGIETAIEDVSHGSNDDSYWESRYEVVSNRMPIFLSRFADKIMKTGKYLTVIRECGKEIGESPECEPLQYTIEDRVYAERIDIAYNYASKKLLHMLMDESKLIDHLNSVKHYFFMDKGDFLVLFMDMAEDELKKDIDDIVPTRLESLLELAVRTSVMSTDPHADLLGIELLGDSVLFQLSQILSHGSSSFLGLDKPVEIPESLRGYEALAFKYKVEWPLSLILNQRNIACYQMLFRHLFYCKWVERQLGMTWKDNKISKRFALKTMKAYAEAFGLRQKMLNFVQNLEYYMMVEVIEPNFHTFLQKVNSKVTSVDDMINEHTIFMEGCLQDCMLTQKTALQLMVKLLNLCMDFASFMHKNHQLSAQFELQGASEQIRKAYEFKPIKEDEEQGNVFASFEQRINQLHLKFNENLQRLLNEIISQQNDHYTGKMLHILSRLDFNEYYGKMNNGYSCPDLS